jgi:hypothetical protein
MNYQIARNGQMYGPYTMEDLQRYLVSGHVLPTDQVKSDEMAEWIPVSQLMSTQTAGVPGQGMGESGAASPSGYAPVSAPYQQPISPTTAGLYPDPPNLHWALVLLLDIVTCSLFQMVWNIILGAWFRRLYPSSKVLLFYIASAILLVVQGIMGQALGLIAGRHGYGHYSYDYGTHVGGYGIYGLVALASWIVRLIARFTFRSELERHYNTVEPIGLRINPVLTFFFGGIYLQSQMNRINDIKHGLRYR